MAKNLQILPHLIDEEMNEISLYFKNRSKDVEPGTLTDGSLTLPGSGEANLEETLKNIRKYLHNLSTIASYSRIVTDSNENTSAINLASAAAVNKNKKLIEQVQNNLENAVPKSHAAEDLTYGGATTNLYGHVKLSDYYTGEVVNVASLAASQKAVAGVYTTLNNAKASVNHRSVSGAYGVADTGGFGHVITSKLYKTKETSLTISGWGDATDSIVPTQETLYNVYTELNSKLTALEESSGTVSDGVTAALNQKAPTVHNASAKTYGGGTTSLYGHVKLRDEYSSSPSGGWDTSEAASSKALYNAYHALSDRILSVFASHTLGSNDTVDEGWYNLATTLVYPYRQNALKSGDTNLSTTFHIRVGEKGSEYYVCKLLSKPSGNVILPVLAYGDTHTLTKIRIRYTTAFNVSDRYMLDVYHTGASSPVKVTLFIEDTPASSDPNLYYSTNWSPCNGFSKEGTLSSYETILVEEDLPENLVFDPRLPAEKAKELVPKDGVGGLYGLRMYRVPVNSSTWTADIRAFAESDALEPGASLLYADPTDRPTNTSHNTFLVSKSGTGRIMMLQMSSSNARLYRYTKKNADSEWEIDSYLSTKTGVENHITRSWIRFPENAAGWYRVITSPSKNIGGYLSLAYISCHIYIEKAYNGGEFHELSIACANNVTKIIPLTNLGGSNIDITQVRVCFDSVNFLYAIDFYFDSVAPMDMTFTVENAVLNGGDYHYSIVENGTYAPRVESLTDGETVMGTADISKDFNLSDNLATKEELENISAAAGSVPTDHSSTTTTYGLGTASVYGHLKLSDIYTSEVAGSGIAASQKAINGVYKNIAARLPIATTHTDEINFSLPETSNQIIFNFWDGLTDKARTNPIKLYKFAPGDGTANYKNVSLVAGRFISDLVSGTHINGNKGQVLIDAVGTPGQYIMLDRLPSANGYFTDGSWNGTRVFTYTKKSIVDNNENKVTHTLHLLNEDGNSYFPGTIYSRGVEVMTPNTPIANYVKRGNINLPGTPGWYTLAKWTANGTAGYAMYAHNSCTIIIERVWNNTAPEYHKIQLAISHAGTKFIRYVTDGTSSSILVDQIRLVFDTSTYLYTLEIHYKHTLGNNITINIEDALVSSDNTKISWEIPSTAETPSTNSTRVILATKDISTPFNIEDNLASKEELANISASAGSVPTNHATNSTTYGGGTSTNYGHVRLADSHIVNTTAADSIAVSPKALYDVYTELSNSISNVSASAGSVPTNHAATSLTYGGGTGSKYGHVKLTDSYASNGGNASGSVAASGKAVYDAYTTLNTALSQKAPKSHESTSAIYGGATSSYYGHVKLNDESYTEETLTQEVLSNAYYQWRSDFSFAPSLCGVLTNFSNVYNSIKALRESIGSIGNGGAAPKYHTNADGSIYGKGTTSVFGHVKLSDAWDNWYNVNMSKIEETAYTPSVAENDSSSNGTSGIVNSKYAVLAGDRHSKIYAHDLMVAHRKEASPIYTSASNARSGLGGHVKVIDWLDPNVYGSDPTVPSLVLLRNVYEELKIASFQGSINKVGWFTVARMALNSDINQYMDPRITTTLRLCRICGYTGNEYHEIKLVVSNINSSADDTIERPIFVEMLGQGSQVIDKLRLTTTSTSNDGYKYLFLEIHINHSYTGKIIGSIENDIYDEHNTMMKWEATIAESSSTERYTIAETNLYPIHKVYGPKAYNIYNGILNGSSSGTSVTLFDYSSENVANFARLCEINNGSNKMLRLRFTGVLTTTYSGYKYVGVLDAVVPVIRSAVYNITCGNSAWIETCFPVPISDLIPTLACPTGGNNKIVKTSTASTGSISIQYSQEYNSTAVHTKLRLIVKNKTTGLQINRIDALLN